MELIALEVKEFINKNIRKILVPIHTRLLNLKFRRLNVLCQKKKKKLGVLERRNQ